MDYVERIAADVPATVDQEHALPELTRQTLGDDRAGEAGTDDEGVVAIAAWARARPSLARRDRQAPGRQRGSSVSRQDARGVARHAKTLQSLTRVRLG